jgi:hypothetical protein
MPAQAGIQAVAAHPPDWPDLSEYGCLWAHIQYNLQLMLRCGIGPLAGDDWGDVRLSLSTGWRTVSTTEKDADTYAWAEGMVRDYFRYVLHRDKVNPLELETWTSRLLATRDPAGVFREFANCEENRRRLAHEQDTRTAYPSGHFYSPVVSRQDAAEDRERIFGPRALKGINLNGDEQERTFRRMAPLLGTLPFSEEADGKHRYHYKNSSYAFGDSSIYWSLIGTLRPSRIIEVGSGFSSAMALDAIEHFGLQTSCVFIDPYPALLMQLVGTLEPRHTVIDRKVQQVDPEIVATLGRNDILFIDSSHVVKTGSDVHYEVTELLPRLAPGAVVHFHDTFHGFEYPERWVVGDNMSWNELYFLHAFLMYNAAFSVMFFNHHFAKTRANVVRELMPVTAARFLLNPGGGLWLRRA